MGYCSTGFPDVTDPWRGCLAGLETLGITAAGGVKGCLALPDALVAGELRRRPLAELWRDPRAFPESRAFTPAALAGDCAGCAHGALCRGGCLELALTMTGEPHRAPFCLHRLETRGQL